MKAAVLCRAGAPLSVEDGIELPALKPGQVLVKIAYSGVCRSQLMEARGKRGADLYLPHLLGHEGSGTVIDTGADVRKVAPGDRVILGWIKGDGCEAGGSIVHGENRTINAGPVTTFSEFSIVSENRCVQLPPGLPMDIAVLFGCAIPTGAGIVINDIQPRPGSDFLILGLGGVGLSALMAAALYAGRRIIAADIEPGKLAIAREFGATHMVDCRSENLTEAVMRITSDVGVDFSIEAAGKVETIEQAFDSVRFDGGLCVFASHPAAGDRIRLDPFDLIRGKRIRGSWGGGTQPDRDIPIFARRLQERGLPLRRLLSNRYTLDQINQALEDLEQRKILRALLVIDPDQSASEKAGR